MSKATAILVGLKRVDPSAYGGWTGENGCWGCELDVDNVERILSPLGYSVQLLKTADATRDKVLRSLDASAASLNAGDTLVFYYSGHGGQQPDEDGDEQDGQDETLVAFDGEILDDQLNVIWPKFRSGVRIVMLSDSCNSGTNYKMMRDVATPTAIRPLGDKAASAMKAQLIHIGGCRDGFTSAGYVSGGIFTAAVCNTWNGGAFEGNYADFYNAVKAAVKASSRGAQDPQYNEYGPVTEGFRNERPFSPSKAPPRKGKRNKFASVHCEIEIADQHLSDVKRIFQHEVPACLLEALDDALSQRPGSASASCTGTSGGGVTCTGTVTYHW